MASFVFLNILILIMFDICVVFIVFIVRWFCLDLLLLGISFILMILCFRFFGGFLAFFGDGFYIEYGFLFV